MYLGISYVGISSERYNAKYHVRYVRAFGSSSNVTHNTYTHTHTHTLLRFVCVSVQAKTLGSQCMHLEALLVSVS